jgi:hypothetical protein
VGAAIELIHGRTHGYASASFQVEVSVNGTKFVLIAFLFFYSARALAQSHEPGYDHTFGRGREQSAGVSFGLLIDIP